MGLEQEGHGFTIGQNCINDSFGYVLCENSRTVVVSFGKNNLISEAIHASIDTGGSTW